MLIFKYKGFQGNSLTITVFSYVDEHRIAFTPSLSQAQRLRKFSEQGRLSVNTVFAVLSEENQANVKVDIYFTAVGLFSLPTEQELLQIFEEAKNKTLLTQKTA